MLGYLNISAGSKFPDAPLAPNSAARKIRIIRMRGNDEVRERNEKSGGKGENERCSPYKFFGSTCGLPSTEFCFITWRNFLVLKTALKVGCNFVRSSASLALQEQLPSVPFSFFRVATCDLYHSSFRSLSVTPASRQLATHIEGCYSVLVDHVVVGNCAVGIRKLALKERVI
jgi:hypothetical protein